MQVALKLHLVLNCRKTQRLRSAGTIGNDGDCVRVRSADARVIRLENRRPFTGLVSSNLTLSARLTGAFERRAASGERRKSGHTPMIPNAKPMAVAAAFIFVIER